jgi:hypothetical protein
MRERENERERKRKRNKEEKKAIVHVIIHPVKKEWVKKGKRLKEQKAIKKKERERRNPNKSV